jgi:hypothetical protein
MAFHTQCAHLSFTQFIHYTHTHTHVYARKSEWERNSFLSLLAAGCCCRRWERYLTFRNLTSIKFFAQYFNYRQKITISFLLLSLSLSSLLSFFALVSTLFFLNSLQRRNKNTKAGAPKNFSSFSRRRRRLSSLVSRAKSIRETTRNGMEEIWWMKEC